VKEARLGPLALQLVLRESKFQKCSHGIEHAQRAAYALGFKIQARIHLSVELDFLRRAMLFRVSAVEHI
jgi:hypothetical protein